MDSEASSFYVVGAVAVVVLAGAWFCCLLSLEIMIKNNIFNSTKNKRPSTCQTVHLDVLLSSLQ